MVSSNINPSVNYIENKRLEPEDIEYNTNIYETEFLGYNLLFALGKEKYAFSDKNIIYYPIYLLKDGKVRYQIGVYEITADQQPSLFDEDGDIDPDRMGEPRLYSYVTSDFLSNPELDTRSGHKSPPELNEDVDSEEEQLEEEEEEDIFRPIPIKKSKAIPNTESVFEKIKIPSEITILEKETKEMSENIRKQYKYSEEDVWMKQFMKNMNYDIIDNEGGGDCLFAVIRDAFVYAGKQTTVTKLRTLLSKEVTEEIFLNYKEKYDMFEMAIENDKQEIKHIKKEMKEIRERIKENRSRAENDTLYSQAKQLGEKYSLIKYESEQSKQMLNEFQFMKDIRNLDEFKQLIMSCRFWGETWAISTLERVLNAKFILFSNESYQHGDLNSVIQCGQMNDGILQKRGKFDPDYYVMFDYNGYHYRLITYKEKGIFTYDEIPYDVKMLILNKCMEKNAGLYSLIPDFVRFKEEIYGLSPSDSEVTNAKEGGSNTTEVDIDEAMGIRNELYDPQIVFQYHDKSASIKPPGQGSGEKMPDHVSNHLRFAVLHGKYKDWRKMLDNSWISPFTLDGHKWNTVEHYLQASKFAAYPEFYRGFSLDADKVEYKRNLDPNVAKHAGGKTGKMKQDGKLIVLRPSTIPLPGESWDESANLEKAMNAKFEQNADLRDMLKQTGNAKLVLFCKGDEPKTSVELMKVRKAILEKDGSSVHDSSTKF